MKKFKLIDTWVSIILIISSFLYALIAQNLNSIIGYFVVGGWQIISLAVHAWKGWFTESVGRSRYHIIISVVACAALCGFIFTEILWFVMVILLFAAPFMAIYYICLCYNEVFVKMQRPLAILK